MPEVLTGPWPLGVTIALFLLGAAVTVPTGARLATLGDVLADRTRLGEAVFGAVFFGFITSLSGIVITAVSAADGHPHLAYGNAVGGIAAQTLAIAAADAAYRRVNLEHAAASLTNMIFGCLLVVLLGLTLMIAFSPDRTVLGVHPGSAVLLACYWGGLRLINDRAHDSSWVAVRTRDTVPDVPDDDDPTAAGRRTGSLWAEFLAVAALVMAGGWVVVRAAEGLVAGTGLSEGFVGGVLLGVVNALPETVTAVAAVRRRAVTLAVAAVIGGNCLDVLNLVVGDVAYRAGSLYHAAGPDQLFLTAAALVMTAVLLGGLLVRQERGWWRLGFDGILLIGGYIAIAVTLAL